MKDWSRYVEWLSGQLRDCDLESELECLMADFDFNADGKAC